MKNKFWLSPILSLFSLDFYKEVTRSKFSLGVKYLAYWSAIAAVLSVLAYYLIVAPRVNEFFTWFEKDMPALAFNADVGFIMNQAGPYVMQNPQYGNIVTFDMEAGEPTQEQILASPFYVTSKKVYFAQSDGGIGVFDVASRGQGNGNTVLVNDVLKRVRTAVVPILGILLPFLVFPAMFVFKFLSGLLFSVIGLVINQFRSSKLDYSTVLSVTFFACTAMTLLDFVKLIPVGGAFLWEIGNFVSIAVTAAYLFFGIKRTEEK